MEGVVNGKREADFATYEQFLEAPLDREEYARRVESARVPANMFYLQGIREDGYREYVFKR